MKLRITVSVATALLALAALGSASASAASCPSAGASNVFSPWKDQRNYVLAPDGWKLSGGAQVVGENESYYLAGKDHSRSLSLPAGSSAVSPPVCMAIDTPVFRMMARNSGDPSSRLRVTASYKLLGLVRTQTIETVTAGSSWAPTNPQSTVLTLAPVVGSLIPSAIEINVTPLDSKGKWQVDDLYIDPFARR
jgi:hypothetical protein